MISIALSHLTQAPPTMALTNATIKQISGLHRKKNRQQTGWFVAEGDRIVREVLDQSRYVCAAVYAVEKWVKEQNMVGDPRVEVVTEKDLSRLSHLTTPNRALAVLQLPEISAELPAELPNGWSLYLDGVQSPANLGALLRIADWFGFHHVIGGPGTADLYNPKSIQASMGSFLRVAYRAATLADVRSAYADLPTFGADLRGDNIYSYAAPGAGVLVIGAEGPGVRPDTRLLIDHWLTIPRAPGREAESLNAAVAAGILAGGLTAAKLVYAHQYHSGLRGKLI